MNFRTHLATALEELAQSDEDRKIIADYKLTFEKMNEVDERYQQAGKQYHDMMVTTGKRDAAAKKTMEGLLETRKKLADQISEYDLKLLRLEQTDFLKRALDIRTKQVVAEKKAERVLTPVLVCDIVRTTLKEFSAVSEAFWSPADVLSVSFFYMGKGSKRRERKATADCQKEPSIVMHRWAVLCPPSLSLHDEVFHPPMHNAPSPAQNKKEKICNGRFVYV